MSRSLNWTKAQKSKPIDYSDERPLITTTDVPDIVTQCDTYEQAHKFFGSIDKSLIEKIWSPDKNRIHVYLVNGDYLVWTSKTKYVELK